MKNYKLLEKIAEKQTPKATDDDHPFPNYSDSDIWKAGFVSGIEHLLKVANMFRPSLEALLLKEYYEI